MSNNQYSEIDDFADAFRALGNPHRLRIFLTLAECCRGQKTCKPDIKSCVGDVGRNLDIAPSTVSHHMKELRRAGLVHMERNGQNVDCWVEPKTVKVLSKFFRKAAA
ncbi:MAG: helix-turn-helix transcriptional regulator [Rhodospirillales bacterium]|nr:helix-turn-helix transcriptional regulator [Rhodospirillales bacterium]